MVEHMRTLFIASITIGLLATPVAEAGKTAQKPTAAKATTGKSAMASTGSQKGGKGGSSGGGGSGKFPDISGLPDLINGFINRARGF
jgi:hypothetical protein